jgi:hypothetical protein
MNRRAACVLSALLAWATTGGAQDPTTHLVIIAGVSGESRIGTEWRGHATVLATAATTRLGIPTERVTVLLEDSTMRADWLRGRSTRVSIERVLGGLARSLTASDRLLVVLIAHGSSLTGDARVNLPGPDMTAADFARVLAPATAPTIAVVHTGSASADFATALAGPRRIVVTATKSAREQNETIFPGPFVRALSTDAGDSDKDGRVSLFEAFTFAQHEVEQHFAAANLLPSEHAVLSDGAEGGRAKQFTLGSDGRGSASAAALAARAEVQSRLDALRARRSTMTEDAYLDALEPLMVELAERTRVLRRAAP